MNIFVVAPAFEFPVQTLAHNLPESYSRLSASQCGSCHEEIYAEWQTTIHRQAWNDPYFQVDWRFDGQQQICKNCHTPLDRQQEYLVTGFTDSEKLKPILVQNPDYDESLQHEGVTCAGCHFRNGKILGVLGITQAPHPVEKIDDPNALCVRCHIVPGDRWDTFFKVPPCGTVAELHLVNESEPYTSHTGEQVVFSSESLNCVQCHMPLVQRSLVKGGEIRTARQHLWRGGHDIEQVKRAMTATFTKQSGDSNDKEVNFVLTLKNTGAGHYFPTGTPDRHLTVDLSLRNKSGDVIKNEHHVLKRTTMWRPFIIDLWDTRLKHGEESLFSIQIPKVNHDVYQVRAQVTYHLLHEKRRRLIGYQNSSPISYEIFNDTLSTNSQ